MQAGTTSARAIVDYLKTFDSGKRVHAAVGEPDIKGRFFYRDDLQAVNFRRAGVPVTAALEELLEMMDQENPHTIAIQAIPVNEILPGFAAKNGAGGFH